MPRKGAVARRPGAVDQVFANQTVGRLINKVMTRGKKSTAERIVYHALDAVKEKSGKEPVKLLEQALHNIMPVLEVRPRRVGGATYQVPVEVRPDRRVSLGMRWLVQYARSRSGKTMRDKLAAEILDASNNTGSAVKRREDTHKMAEANKAFAHYRW
ncbi:MAG: 30S ribosomal protein S7 [Bacillati bacterium ANGP1]|uniref:Small ribosomal subunit protein uS7 n=2 Tax=Candidatus Segetimicrobium genomatis TaxID=2569760 RepID=A0A537J8D7_9BACT|nr:MAG: 30S ribosomal protein S7 [Terrabacteria group bacterium ANGP1]